MKKKKRSLPRLRNIDFDSPREKKSFNQELFIEVAPKYERIKSALSFGRDQAWKRALVAGLPDIPDGAVCVDIACGTGDLCERLAARYARSTIVGVDQNPRMLAFARERLGPRTNISLVQGDMASIPVKSGSAAILTGGYAIRNAPHLRDALEEIHRVLIPGGVAVFLDFSKPPSRLIQGPRLALLKLWGNIWGILLHRNPEVYGYIAKSLSHFPDRIELTGLLDEAGLHTIDTRYPFFCFLELRWTRKNR